MVSRLTAKYWQRYNPDRAHKDGITNLPAFKLDLDLNRVVANAIGCFRIDWRIRCR
jgi:hypothetical protein